jgi:hypothetical protein
VLMPELFLVSCLVFLCPSAAYRADACERITCWPAGGNPQAAKILRGCEVVLIRTSSADGCRSLDGVPVGKSDR